MRVLAKGTEAERKVAGVEVLAGNGFWRERLGGRTMTVSAPTFFQVNTLAAEALVELAVAALQPDGTDRVVDLYAGAGTFTLPLAEAAGDVVAVEAASSAVRDLRRNLEDSGLWAEVVGGDALRELRGARLASTRCSSIPREPDLPSKPSPRSRALAREPLPTSRAIRRRSARDAKSLESAGYRLEAATPVDLFPQTFHVETVAKFVRA